MHGWAAGVAARHGEALRCLSRPADPEAEPRVLFRPPEVHHRRVPNSSEMIYETFFGTYTTARLDSSDSEEKTPHTEK